MFLVVCGGGFAYWNHKQNKPAPVWVPMQINSEIPDEKRLELARDLKSKIDRPELLAQVSKDLDLPRKWSLPTDKEAAAEISRRLFVNPGEADTPAGKVPSINVGLDGIARDRGTTEDIVKRLMQDVSKIISTQH